MLKRLLCGKGVRWKFVSFIAAFILIQVFLSSQVFDSGIRVTTHSKQKRNAPVTDLTSYPPAYNVIINSYMRGGSSFLGRLLGFHPDSFYFYEPLWKFTIWDYFNGRGYTCSSTVCNCRHSNLLDLMVDYLSNMNTCRDFAKLIAPSMTDFYSGSVWENFTSCIKKYELKRGAKILKSSIAPSECVNEIQSACSKRKHVISKVLRLTVDVYETILQQSNNSIVLHLFRDPRATLNSRITTKWYPAKKGSDINTNAKCLCKRMLYDYEAGLRLMTSFPGRFKFVMYEDIVENIAESGDKLYKLAGMAPIKHIGRETFEKLADFGFKTDHSKRDNSTDYASWWRHKIDWDVVKQIDTVCGNVYHVLGYQAFQNETDLRDINKASVKLPDQFRLV